MLLCCVFQKVLRCCVFPKFFKKCQKRSYLFFKPYRTFRRPLERVLELFEVKSPILKSMEQKRPGPLKEASFFYRNFFHLDQTCNRLKLLYLLIETRFLIKSNGKILLRFETFGCEKNFVALLRFLLLFCNKRNKATTKSQK